MTRFSDPRALVRELAEHDDRQLMDIGVVRDGDGALHLADDSGALATETSFIAHPLVALSEMLRNLMRTARAVPFHSSASGPVILTEQLAA